MISIGTKTMR